MNLGEAYVTDFLAHYASEYYDPVKAREYYLRTRELKGKRSTSDLTVKTTGRGKRGGVVTKVNKERSEQRRQAWDYAKNQIGEAKKADLEGLSEERKAAVDQARQTTQARRDEIRGKLAGLIEQLTGRKIQESDAIDAEAESALARVEQQREEKARLVRAAAERKISAVPPVPDGIRGSARERLVAARQKKIDKINGDAATDIGVLANDAAAEREAISANANDKRKALSEQTQNQKANERQTATVDREQLSSDLKATVEKARANYEAGKARLIAQYEATMQSEFEAIRDNV